jgi:hypothetical protein
MTRLMLISLVLLACLGGGCRTKDKHDESSVPVELASEEEGIPVHRAEIHVIRRGPSGQSSVTAWLVSENLIKADSSTEGQTTITAKQWSKESTSLTVEVGANRECVISPRFIKHESGSDIWRFELGYTSETSAGTQQTTREAEVSFNGREPVTVIEDEVHEIIVRPRRDSGEFAPADPSAR